MIPLEQLPHGQPRLRDPLRPLPALPATALLVFGVLAAPALGVRSAQGSSADPSSPVAASVPLVSPAATADTSPSGVVLIRVPNAELAANERLEANGSSRCRMGLGISKRAPDWTALDHEIGTDPSPRLVVDGLWFGDAASAVAGFGATWAAEDDAGHVWMASGPEDALRIEALSRMVTPAGHVVWDRGWNESWVVPCAGGGA